MHPPFLVYLTATIPIIMPNYYHSKHRSPRRHSRERRQRTTAEKSSREIIHYSRSGYVESRSFEQSIKTTKVRNYRDRHDRSSSRSSRCIPSRRKTDRGHEQSRSNRSRVTPEQKSSTRKPDYQRTWRRHETPNRSERRTSSRDRHGSDSGKQPLKRRNLTTDQDRLPANDARRKIADQGRPSRVKVVIENKATRIPTEGDVEGHAPPPPKRLRPRDEVKGITLAIKRSAIECIEQEIENSLYIRNFDNTVGCISAVRKFIIEHFGPKTDPQRLDNRLEALKFRYQGCYAELELYKTFFDSIVGDNPKVFGTIKGLIAEHPVSDGVWKTARDRLPTVDGVALSLEQISRARMSESDCSKLNPENMDHEQFCEKYMAIKANMNGYE